MASVIIGTTSYPVYVALDEVDAYLAASFRFAGAWAALEYEQRKQVLVESTRNFEVRDWAGDPVSSSQDLAWPRTGAFGTNVTPAIILTAFQTLAGLLAVNPGLLGTGTSTPPVQSLREGPVAASFFFQKAAAPGSVAEVDALLAAYLGSDDAALGSLIGGGVSGMDAESGLDFDYSSTRGLA